MERDSDEGTFHVKEVNNHVNERTDDKEIELVHIDDAFLGEWQMTSESLVLYLFVICFQIIQSGR